MKERMKETFKDVQGIIGVTGREQEVIRRLKELFTPYADEIKVTPIGNLIATKRGKGKGPRLMLCAHADEIGLVVKSILPSGFIIYERVGVVPNKLLIARHVTFQGEKGPIPGVIGMKPGHLQTPEEANKVGTSKQSFIDVGASSREEVLEMGIRVGTRAVFTCDVVEMHNPDIIATRSIDDRINCAILVELFRELQNVDFDGEICAVISTQEEMIINSSASAVFNVEPDYAIALDTIPAGDTPDIPTDILLPVRIGNGPACPLADGAIAFYHFAQKAVVDMIECCAKKENINLQFLTLVEDMYATDAAAMAHAWKGVPTAVIAIPRRYSHSPVELFNINDAVSSLKLLKRMVQENGKHSLDFI